MIDEMPEIRQREGPPTLIEESVRKRRKEVLLAKARQNQEAILSGKPASQAIREDRSGILSETTEEWQKMRNVPEMKSIEETGKFVPRSEIRD